MFCRKINTFYVKKQKFVPPFYICLIWKIIFIEKRVGFLRSALSIICLCTVMQSTMAQKRIHFLERPLLRHCYGQDIAVDIKIHFIDANEAGVKFLNFVMVPVIDDKVLILLRQI